MPKIDVAKVPVETAVGYPDPFWKALEGRSRKRLGNAAGLTQFGVNLATLKPGTWSSQRHWHERQDEFIYVVEGEVSLVTDAGETPLRAGMFAGFRAGEPNGHHLVNRSPHLARVLEIGTRTAEETAHYSDIDMIFVEGSGYATRDGKPLK